MPNCCGLYEDAVVRHFMDSLASFDRDLFVNSIASNAKSQTTLQGAIQIVYRQAAILADIRSVLRAPPDDQRSSDQTPAAPKSALSSKSIPNTRFVPKCLHCHSSDHLVQACPTCPDATRQTLLKDLRARMSSRHINRFRDGFTQDHGGVAIFSPRVIASYCLDYGADTCIMSSDLMQRLLDDRQFGVWQGVLPQWRGSS